MKTAIESGVTLVLALALQLAGQLGRKEVVFPGALVTQSFLLENQIKNMDRPAGQVARTESRQRQLGRLASVGHLLS